MKILYFHQHFVTPEGAGAIRSYVMARRLVERGHTVTMVCGRMQGGTTGLQGSFLKGRRDGIVNGINVIEFDLAYSNIDSFAKRILTFLSFVLRGSVLAFTESYDLLFATTTPLTAGIPGILARLLRGKPFVFEVRDLWPELPKAMGVIKNPLLLWLMEILEWISYHSADRLIGLSPGIVDGIVRRGIQRDHVIMIPNGCDLNIFTANEEPWRPANIGDEDLMAVYAGTHGIANGLSAVLDVAVELKKRNRHDIKIVLIGQGKLKPELQARATQENLDNVVFHDPVNKGRLAGLMRSTDIGLQILENVPAFYYGTSPNKFFDYLAAGVPVLVNYPGWMAEMVLNENCGFVVPPGDSIAFADVLEMAAAKNHFRAIGERCKQLAMREFDRTGLAEKFVNWLEGAM